FSRDWSSDVCSSDLDICVVIQSDSTEQLRHPTEKISSSDAFSTKGTLRRIYFDANSYKMLALRYLSNSLISRIDFYIMRCLTLRSEERRVGKVCRSW